jgi:hypothetical protein
MRAERFTPDYVADIVGASPGAIPAWERHFIVRPPAQSGGRGGRSDHRTGELELLKEIKHGVSANGLSIRVRPPIRVPRQDPARPGST